MLLYPAIDILEGRAVRLRQGHFDQSTVYYDDPLDAARSWAQAGARALHVVDLDGARGGTPAQLDTLARIVDELGLPVQTGGGLRSEGAVRDALGTGVARVVIGTAAYEQPELLDRLLAEHGPERVAVAVDVRGGSVSAAGWTRDTGRSALEVVGALRERGVGAVIYTDVDRDGMLDGPDLDEVERIAAAFARRTLYSGGVGSLEHLRTLGALELEGVIVGKALFEGRFTVAEGQAALDARASDTR